ncbi:uncharacterized protein [Diabrotica undecimpunctata]|uniref:uncharacterized protein isoform X2 n=1 Tax=Diabrotica undecimpunctata TaxID=50387 RepID=UPI003B63332F
MNFREKKSKNKRDSTKEKSKNKDDNNNNTRSRSLPSGDGDRYTCCGCHKSWSTMENVWTHICKAEPIPYVKCHTCLKVVYRKEFYRHLKDHTAAYTSVDTVVKPYTCEICFQKFPRQATLKAHMKKHKNKNVHMNIPNKQKNIPNKQKMPLYLPENTPVVNSAIKIEYM